MEGDVTLVKTDLVRLVFEERDRLRVQLAESDADLKEVLRAVLYHFGPSGANKVTEHAMKAREVRRDNDLMDEIEANLCDAETDN